MTRPAGSRSPAQTRILICDELSPAAMEVFRARGFEPETALKQTEDQLVLRAKDCHALIVRSATKITRRVLEACSELRVVGRAGVGVDNVDCDAATEHGVVVMNTPTGNTITTAELALALMVSLARHIPRGNRVARAGSWDKKGLTGSELTGKTLGVIGLGRIGRVVADRALGLRMKVLAHDPYLDPKSAPPIAGIEWATLEALLAKSDFVTLHVPLVDATKNLISRERLFAMKKGARLINAARGGIVDEAALLEALEKGHLAGAALDVLAEEPPAKDHPLLARDDVIITPHLGASSHEAQHAVAVDIAAQICDFFVEGVAHNAVNVPAVSGETLREMAPYVLLSEKLGAFVAQLAKQPLARIEISLSGEIARRDARHVPLAMLVGLLRPSMGAGVNFVNAPLAARERGIEVFERKDESDPIFHSRVRLRATCADGETHTLGGTIFGRSARIVEVDGHELDLDPKGAILITRHLDRPGVVGQLGTLLGEHAVNIRRIELGPPAEGDRSGLATGFLALYSEPSSAVLTALAKLDSVREVRLVHL